MTRYFLLSQLPPRINEGHVRKAFESRRIFNIFKGSLNKVGSECVGFYDNDHRTDVSTISGYKFSPYDNGITFAHISYQCYKTIKVSARQDVFLNKKSMLGIIPLWNIKKVRKNE